MCIYIEWLCTWLRAKLAVCIASAFHIKVWLPYEQDVDFRRPQYSQHTCEHSETLSQNFITVKFGKLNFRRALNKLVVVVVVVVCPNNAIMLI